MKPIMFYYFTGKLMAVNRFKKPGQNYLLLLRKRGFLSAQQFRLHKREKLTVQRSIRTMFYLILFYCILCL